MKSERFKATIQDYFKRAGRHELPWRNTRDPYRILVSETMLQQTQVARVLKKYDEFLREFPTVHALAKASVAQVLRVWQGLGYNRRALMLKRAAEEVVERFGGVFPGKRLEDAEVLESLPGIGQSTRGAIMAFAYGVPTVFIETNIRSVFIHFFFSGKKSEKAGKKISDRDILPLIEKMLDKADPRSWYYALMDYGVYLKQTRANPSRRSAHHIKQSTFKGSKREVRSRILRLILAAEENVVLTAPDIARRIGDTKHDVAQVTAELVKEGFIVKTRKGYRAR